MNLVLIVFAYLCCRSMARATVPLNFNAFLEKAKLKDDGSNHTDWVRNLRIILIAAQKNYVLEALLSAKPAVGAAADVMNVWQSKADDYSIVQCAMLYGLESGLQRCFECHGAYGMLQELKLIFQANARVERYEVSNKFYSCKMEENSSVSEHILRMSGYHNHLTQLGVELPDDCVIDRVLQSLPPSYKGFVMNYNMQGMENTIPELFAMIKAAEVEVKKEHQVLVVNKTTSFKKKGKGKKGNFKKNGKQVAAQVKKPKSGPKPETECFYCKATGHWKRNCPKYLADKKDGMAKGIFDIHVIDVYLANTCSSTWVFDTRFVAHIFNSKLGVWIKRRLDKDKVTMLVENGSKVDVIAVGTLPLHLPSGLVLDLNNCYLVPALSMNIISGSCLMRDGYSFKSEDNGCSIYMSNIFYGHAPLMRGLYLLNLDSSDNHIHNIEATRCKVNNGSATYLWHCRLGHIGVKRMKNLHANGLLESLDTCEPCLMGKMNKTPFSGTMERATDLLEIIHTDVSGPMSVDACGGYRYFFTFTDDLSRYGYIYLRNTSLKLLKSSKNFRVKWRII